jgi:predicted GH43/DUF377 family glycosyl hydrolase
MIKMTEALKTNPAACKHALVVRRAENPLLTVTDVKPSREDFTVDGIFNCGATKYGDEYILLCRVAESVKCDRDGFVAFPIVAENQGQSKFEVVVLEKNKYPEYNFTDSRTITKGSDAYSNVVYLTSFSHLRVARSKDGEHFVVDEKPLIMPDPVSEGWGMEDPRVTCINGTYYINYTAVSLNGAATALITTNDFKTFERKGLIFLPENKDVAIFPEKIHGKFLAFNRPVPRSIGTPDIWLSESEDMIHWGQHRHFYGISDMGWENGRIGGGAPPFRTEKGWVKIYHAADKNNRYCLGVFLLDENDPMKIIAKSKVPLLEPEMEYETEGFFGNVVFTCGCMFEKETVKIYYGAADDKICRADITINDLYSHLGIL